jgi:sulfiredoxin
MSMIQKCAVLNDHSAMMVRVQEIPINKIRRPLPRRNDPGKVAALMESIQAVGLREPIEVLEVEGEYYGFSGCHRYEACQRLGHETIPCRVRRAPRAVLNMHLA